MPLTDPEVARALDVARAMALAGVPIFVAPPRPGSKAGYALPDAWENTAADPSAVDAWRPGWALCAIGGHVCDFVDVDPRNGGTESAEALWQAGQFPNAYGLAFTPSGGTHHLIQPLGQGKGELVAGVDLQGGRPDGSGRGFVFLPPTVRASKVDGVARPYRWSAEPELVRLSQWRGEQSGAHLASIAAAWKVNAGGHGHVTVPWQAPGDVLLADRHTVQSADKTIAGKAAEVTAHIRTRGWAGFRGVLNGAAYTLGAYVGSGYMTYDQAFAVLESAIQLAGFPINAESSRTVHVGLEDGAQAPILVVRQGARPLARTAGTGGDFGRQLIDAADLDELPDPEPLIAGWLFQNTTARLVGQPGSYKSFVSLDMALCVALGRPWHGRPVKQTPVLYVVGEGLAGYKRRVAAWCEVNEVAREDLRGKLLLTRGSVQIGGEDWPALTEWVLENKSGLLVIDTQARATVGFEENSSTEQGQVIEHCNELREITGGVLLLVHHTGHANGEAAERGRGSSAWRAAVDTELLLTKTGEYCGALRCDRQKDAESGMTVAVQMVKAADSLAVVIGDEAPLSPRSQWLSDQVAAGVRYDSAASLTGAVRLAGHKIGNADKAPVFEEYHRLVAKITAESYDPNTAGVAAGENPFTNQDHLI
jgi:hypothetical protein